MTDEARILKKKFLAARIWAQQGQVGSKVFCYFLEFGSYVFLAIAYNDRFRQFLTSSRGKTHEKKSWETKFGPNVPKSGLKLGFFCHFLKFGSLVFVYITLDDSLEQCLTASCIKNFGGPNLGPTLNQAQNEVFCHFLNFGS